MRRFPETRAMAVILPEETIRRLLTAASGQWGPTAVDPRTGPDAWVLVWQHGAVGQPCGGAHVRRGQPGPATGIVDQIGWNVDHGGSFEMVVSTLNGFVGWPVFR